jgi:acetyl esterase/lipase
MARRSAVCSLAAVALAAGVPGPAGAGDPKPATTVAQPPGRAPLKFRDPVFDRVKVTRGLRYKTGLTLDLFEPVGDRTRKRPAVVWVHGGGFVSGNSRNPRMVEIATEFARRGYVTVSINYRLIRSAEAARIDATAAVSWLRKRDRRYRIDRSRIGIGGSSAGAITAMLVGTHTRAVRGVVSISGGLPGELEVDRRDAPILFFHGTADRTVPYDWAVDSSAAFAAAGVPVVLETLKGAGHVPWAKYHRRFVTHSAYFLYDKLRLARLPSP